MIIVLEEALQKGGHCSEFSGTGVWVQRGTISQEEERKWREEEKSRIHLGPYEV